MWRDIYDEAHDLDAEHARQLELRDRLDEQTAVSALYGDAHRSGNVVPLGPVCHTFDFDYVQTDVPPGMQLNQWTHQTWDPNTATSAAGTADAA